mmetsp:Transcript_50797/g.133490  ORF Transcript_50797/g.133490 Transcript_50797/m.133490 type:complete len:140 (+) Transcript_50797:854-1273(+)
MLPQVLAPRRVLLMALRRRWHQVQAVVHVAVLGTRPVHLVGVLALVALLPSMVAAVAAVALQRPQARALGTVDPWHQQQEAEEEEEEAPMEVDSNHHTAALARHSVALVGQHPVLLRWGLGWGHTGASEEGPISSVEVP